MDLFEKIIKFYAKYENKINNAVRLLILFLLFYYSGYLQYIPVLLFRIKNITGTTSVILNTYSNTVVLLVFILVYFKDLKKEWKTFRTKLMENLDTGIKYYFLGLFLMMVSNLILMYLFKAGQSNNEQAVQQMISSFPWLMLINAGLIAPMVEEILFRKSIRDLINNKYIYVLVSGLTFGLMHVITSSTSLLSFMFFIPYTFLGLAFAATNYKTKTVFTSIIFHITHNVVLIMISILPLLLK